MGRAEEKDQARSVVQRWHVETSVWRKFTDGATDVQQIHGNAVYRSCTRLEGEGRERETTKTGDKRWRHGGTDGNSFNRLLRW